MEAVGTCCFCKGPCNPASQACGSCMRTYPPVYIEDPLDNFLDVPQLEKKISDTDYQTDTQRNEDLKELSESLHQFLGKDKIEKTRKTANSPVNSPVVKIEKNLNNSKKHTGTSYSIFTTKNGSKT